MRIRWTNHLETVDAYLQADNLPKAKQIARAVLEEEGFDELLSEEEVTYLERVIALDRIADPDRVGPEDLKNAD